MRGNYLSLLILFRFAAAIAESAPLYTITNLNVGPGATVAGINNQGDVVGCFCDNSVPLTFLFTPGVGVVDRTPPIPDTPRAINNVGQILYAEHLFTPGSGFTNIADIVAPSLPSGYAASLHDLNDRGELVGVATARGPGMYPLVFTYSITAGFIVVASDLRGTLTAQINQLGNVLYDFGFPPAAPVVHRPGQPPQVGRGGYRNGFAYDINDADQVVGCGPPRLSDATHPFIYSAEGVGRDLIIPPFTQGCASAVNNSGDSVGRATTNDLQYLAALYPRDGGVIDLNTVLAPGSGWFLTDAMAINDVGQIAGLGTLNGIPEGFLLTPVPEPSTMILVGFTALVTALFQQSRGRRKSLFLARGKFLSASRR